MTKPELGTKRLCANCSARYYDLNKTPITCPKCGTPFEVVATTTQKRFGQRAVVSQPEVEPEEVPSETKAISLEEVETEDVETEDVETDEADETAKDDSKDTLIEEVEEEDSDVSEIIGGDVEDNEDT
jgi:uncharacterized protein (TIGR02300 family)